MRGFLPEYRNIRGPKLTANYYRKLITTRLGELLAYKFVEEKSEMVRHMKHIENAIYASLENRTLKDLILTANKADD